MRNDSDPSGGEEGWVVEIGPDESPEHAIIRGIAAITGASATNLDPLYESVDINALDELLRHAEEHDGSACIEFTYDGYTIIVTTADRIRIIDHTPETMPVEFN